MKRIRKNLLLRKDRYGCIRGSQNEACTKKCDVSSGKRLQNDSVMYNNSQKGFWPTLYIGGDTMYLFFETQPVFMRRYWCGSNLWLGRIKTVWIGA